MAHWLITISWLAFAAAGLNVTYKASKAFGTLEAILAKDEELRVMQEESKAKDEKLRVMEDKLRCRLQTFVEERRKVEFTAA